MEEIRVMGMTATRQNLTKKRINYKYYDDILKMFNIIEKKE